MLLTRYVLFASRGALPSSSAAKRVLSAIPHVTVLDSSPGHVVHDNASGLDVQVTLADGPLVVADARALAAQHRRSEPKERALIAATDARFELRCPEVDRAIDVVLLIQDALERLTGGFGYDFEFYRIVIAREGEARLIEEGPEEKAEGKRLMDEIRAMSEEELDRQMTEQGFDPEAVGRRGAAFAAQLLEQRHIARALEAAIVHAAPQAREARSALMTKLAAAYAEPAIGGALGRLLRGRGLATMSDAEVQAVADEVAKWMESAGDDEGD